MRAEAIAPLAVIRALPERFRDRDVVHFEDNTGALFAYARGSSKDVPTARMVHMFHAYCAALGTRVWFEYVPSGANLADQPSRGEFDLLRELGSESFELDWPDATDSWLEAVDDAFRRYAAASTRMERRWRDEIEEAIETVRAWAARDGVTP